MLRVLLKRHSLSHCFSDALQDSVKALKQNKRDKQTAHKQTNNKKTVAVVPEKRGRFEANPAVPFRGESFTSDPGGIGLSPRFGVWGGGEREKGERGEGAEGWEIGRAHV